MKRINNREAFDVYTKLGYARSLHNMYVMMMHNLIILSN